MRWHRLGIVLGVTLLLPQLACADLITLTSVRDNTIYSEFPNNSNGLGGAAGQRGLRFDSGTTAANGIRRGLVAFDVAGNLPTGARIDSVRLLLTLSGVAPGGPSSTIVELHSLLSNWGEGTSGTSQGQGAAATIGDATWNHNFFNTSRWTTAGGDFSPTASASLSVGNAINTQFTWTSSQLAADVQDWLDSPLNNFGWVLINDEVRAQSVRSFYSHEWVAQPNFRPQLVIEFTPQSVVVHEPSSLVLLGFASASLAASAAWRRRRGKEVATAGQT